MLKISHLQALNAWKQCQDKLAEIQPWIEKGEVKVNIGFNPPASLPQAKSDLTEIKVAQISSYFSPNIK